MKTARQQRLDAMLKAIDERMASIPVEELARQLHECGGGGGPTAEEFVESFGLAHSDFEESPVVENERDRHAAKRFLECLSGLDVWVPSERRLERLAKLGWVEKTPANGWKATPALNQLNLVT